MMPLQTLRAEVCALFSVCSLQKNTVQFQNGALKKSGVCRPYDIMSIFKVGQSLLSCIILIPVEIAALISQIYERQTKLLITQP